MLVHIASQPDWRAAEDRGQYIHPSLDEDGFIHCSRPEQVEDIAAAVDLPAGLPLVLLCLDTDRLDSELRWERDGRAVGPEDPAAFPHVYGPIDLDAVVAVEPFETNDDGVYRVPDAVWRLADEDAVNP